MKKLLLTFLLLIGLFVKAQGPQTIITLPASQFTTEPTILYLPPLYPKVGVKYPVLFFFHGAGEAGTNPASIYGSSSAGGPSYFIAQNRWPASFINPVDNKAYEFIVISPQSNNNFSTPSPSVNYMLDYVNSHYNIDLNRIYLTGLSAGGVTTYEYISHSGTIPRWPAAAASPMSMAENPSEEGVEATIVDNVYVWGFGSESDIWGIQTHLYITGSYGGNNGPTPPGLGMYGHYTPYTGGHCCWNQFYDPNFRENGMSIYEWFLTHTRESLGTLPIVLASFQAHSTNKSVELDWRTATESNTDHFVVERSEDGKNFTEVVSIPTQAKNGNSSTPIDYAYIDDL